MNANHIISNIYNYCDRWCERCTFIDRCAMGIVEQKRWAKGDDWTPKDFLEAFENLYPASEDQMAEWLEQNDLAANEVEPDEPPEPDLKIPQLEEEMRKRGAGYYVPLQQFLKDNTGALKSRGIDLFGNHSRHQGRDTQERSALAEAMEVILWYQHLMFVKAGRAVSGLEDMHDPAFWKNALQSDANGSAKIVMIAAERSLGAWEILRRLWPEKQPEILSFMRTINGLRQRIEKLFPEWRKFIRPGFDTEKDHPLPFGEN